MYLAKKVKKKRLFQKSYEADGNFMFITNTKRAKKKFLKSGIRDVCFGGEFEKDGVMGKFLEVAEDYDYEFLCEYLEDMIEYMANFFKIKLPCENIALFSEDERIIEKCVKYTKMLSVVGVCRESEIRGGVTVRFVKMLKTLPDMVISEKKESLSPIFKVPRISLGEDCERSNLTLTKNTICFKTNLFPFPISYGALVYFLKNGEKPEYEIESFRKKVPPLFVFSPVRQDGENVRG